MEIEAKYRVTHRQIFTALLRIRNLGTFSLCPEPSLEHQTNTYYDTPEGALAAQRLSLRVRQVTDLHVATVKRSAGGVGAIHVREEWETPIFADPHPAAWPSSVLRERMRTLVGAAPLIALFALDTRRQRIAVRRSGTSIAELCLDEGHIQAKGRILGFRELEIELCNQGVPDDLQQIAGLLVDHFALIPEPRGKRSRGLALLQALTEPYARTVGAQRSREAIVW